jgi:DNA-binding transcriptional MerR regulator/methylmalonyl-CoA mutase cobalamin-binding subunit
MSSFSGYSIRVVEAQTGIPSDTLRVWERRYGFPKPARKPGGGRLYAESDVTRLRLIARARDAGYRPGDVLALPDRELANLVAAPEPKPVKVSAGPDLAALIDDAKNDRVDVLRSSLRTLSVTLGPRAFVTDVAQPFAAALGTAWAAGELEVRQEHLATALLSARLRVLLSTFEDGEEPPVVVLATLPGEVHTLGLDLVAVYLASQRATPRLLGANTPPDQIAAAARAFDAAVVGISVPVAREGVAEQIDELVRALPRRCQLWIGGAAAPLVTTPSAKKRVALSWPDIEVAVAAART